MVTGNGRRTREDQIRGGLVAGVPRELPTPLEVLQADREALPDGAPIASPVC